MFHPDLDLAVAFTNFFMASRPKTMSRIEASRAFIGLHDVQSHYPRTL
jgi:hypothetical protein